MKLNIRQFGLYLGIGAMAMIFSFSLSVRQVSADTATGTIVSSVKDMNGPVDWATISWNASTSASSTITMKVRTGTSSSMASAPAWTTCDDIASGTDISTNNCVSDGQQYVQYMATFTTDYTSTSTFVSAELYDVTIGYNVVSYLISSWYDTTVSDNKINKISWNETLPGTTDVLFQIRTAPDSSGSPGTPTSWMGTSSALDYYTDPGGGETINSSHRDGSSDRWIQYKVYLKSDGTDVPILQDVTIEYDADIPVITDISPTSTTTAPSALTLTVNGSDFQSNATIKLANDTNQTATGTIIASTSEQITATFTMTNYSPGRYTLTVTNPNGGVDTLDNSFLIETNTGTIVSSVKDLGAGYGMDTISWTGTTTASSTITMKVRSDDNPGMTGATDWSSCNTVSNGALITTSNCATNGQRYLQYQAILTTTYATSSTFATPELGDVTIGTYHFASSSLISNYFDTEDIHNVINNLTWSETVPGSSDVCVQIRTSPGEAGEPTSWSDWYGATGIDTCYTTPTGNSIYYTQRDGRNDRWLQYKITLVPNGIYAPSLQTGIDIIYVTASTTPTVVTSPIAWTGSTVAKGLGRVSDNGTGPIAKVGFEYGLTQTPTWSIVKDVYINNDAFDVVMPNLDKDTKYYYRAFAVNARGTGTASEWEEFTTKATTTLQTMILKTRTILKSNIMLR